MLQIRVGLTYIRTHLLQNIGSEVLILQFWNSWKRGLKTDELPRTDDVNRQLLCLNMVGPPTSMKRQINLENWRSQAMDVVQNITSTTPLWLQSVRMMLTHRGCISMEQHRDSSVPPQHMELNLLYLGSNRGYTNLTNYQNAEELRHILKYTT